MIAGCGRRRSHASTRAAIAARGRPGRPRLSPCAVACRCAPWLQRARRRGIIARPPRDPQWRAHMVDLGIFLPVTNNGWIISKTSPQFLPTFALNRAICELAERIGFDYVFSMAKWRGFGGE